MEDGQFYAFTAVQTVVVCGLLWFMFTMTGAWDWQRCLGMALIVVGVAGIALARYQLGKSFAVKAEAHQRVTHGIYSKSAISSMCLERFWLPGSSWSSAGRGLWLFLPAIIVMQTFRSRHEARVLEAAFGDAYREYRRNTWF
jgi:protein-S-isoprenylcysteine O-methyltransferase Ste14